MLVKAASHLRPIFRLQGIFANSQTVAASPSTSSTASTVSQAFSNNATLLTQAQVQAGQAQIATVQQGGGNFVGAAWGLGTGAGGSGPNAGGSGAGSKFSGYTGFGRTLTQAPQSESTQATQDGDDDETKPQRMAEIRARRPSNSQDRRPTTSPGSRRANASLTHPSPKSSSQEKLDDRLSAEISEKESNTVAQPSWESESIIEDPDSDIETPGKHRLLRQPRASQGTHENVPLWTVGLRGGKFVRLPVRLTPAAARHFSTLPRSIPHDGTRSVDDLETVGLRRSSVRNERLAGSVQKTRRNSTSAVPSTSIDDGKQSDLELNEETLEAAAENLRTSLQKTHDIKCVDMIQAVDARNLPLALALARQYIYPAALNPDPNVAAGPEVEPPYFEVRGFNIALGILRTYRASGDPITEILNAYNLMIQRNLLPDSVTFSHVIIALLERDAEIANAENLTVNQRKGLDFDAVHFPKDSISLEFLKRHESELAEKIQKAEQLDGVLQTLKQENNYSKALALWRSATKQTETSLGRQAYATIIHAAARHQDIETAKAAFEQATHHGSLTGAAFGGLIKAYSLGSIPKSEQVYRQYIEEPPNSTQERRFISANGAFRTPGLLLGPAPVYEEMLAVYARDGLSASIEEVFGIIREKSISPHKRNGLKFTTKMFYNVINELYDAGKPDEAMRMIESLDTPYVDPSMLSWSLRSLVPKVILKEDAKTLVEIFLIAIKLANKPQPPAKALELVTNPDDAARIVQLLLPYLKDRGSQFKRTDMEILQVLRVILDNLISNKKWSSVAALHWWLTAQAAWKIGIETSNDDIKEIAYEILRTVIWEDNAEVKFRHEIATEQEFEEDAAAIIYDSYRRTSSATGRARIAAHMRKLWGHVPSGLMAELIAQLDEELPFSTEGMQQVLAVNGTFGAISSVLGSIAMTEVDYAAYDRYKTHLESIVRRFAGCSLTQTSVTLLVSLVRSHFESDRAQDIIESTFDPTFIPPAPKVPSQEPSDSFVLGPQQASSAKKWTIDRSLSGYLNAGRLHQASRRKGKFEHRALECYARLKEAQTQGSVADIHTMAQLMHWVAQAGSEEAVRDIYQVCHEVMASESSQTGELLFFVEDKMLSSCAVLGLLDEAMLRRKAMIEQGMIPSAETYGHLIDAVKFTTDDVSAARKLWDESQQLEVKPNLYLYNTIISQLARARKAEDALLLFADLKQRGIRPSSVTYGALINGCSRVGDVQSATTLFQEMASQESHRPRVPPYNTMMQMHISTSPSREHVLHYYNQMIQAGLHPSSHTYKLLLDAYGSIEPIDLDAMRTVFRNLCADPEVALLGNHWAAMINAYGHVARQPQEAIKVFESIAEHPSTSGQAIDPVCWEMLISVLADHKMIQEMEAYHQKMVDAGVKSNAYINNMLIRGYANVGQIEKSRAIFEQMEDSPSGLAAPNNHHRMHNLIDAPGSRQLNLNQGAVIREPSTFEAMVSAELKAGNHEAARAICDRMETRLYPLTITARIRSLLDDEGAFDSHAAPSQGSLYGGGISEAHVQSVSESSATPSPDSASTTQNHQQN